MEGISTATLAPSSASLGQEAYTRWTLLLSRRLILALETLNCNSITPRVTLLGRAASRRVLFRLDPEPGR